jgi:hypothetical protein
MATVSLEQALIQTLIHNSTINALVAGRVYPLRIPAGGSVPAITLKRVSLATNKSQSEKVLSKLIKVQLTYWDAFDNTYEASQLAASVEGVLDGYKGNLGYGSDLLEVQSIILEDEGFEDDEEKGLAWYDQVYSILVTP